MITQQELGVYLQEFLQCGRYKDYAPNGLQIEGKTKVKRICTAVTASEQAIEQAIADKADALLVHHGYFWRGEEPVITGMKQRRIKKILAANLNLFAYHLPLDCHLQLGNNACLARLLQTERVQTHSVGGTDDLLWSGQLLAPMDAFQFSAFIANVLGHSPQLISGHERMVSRIAWCSGAAQDFIVEANLLGVDAYLSGEVAERTYYQAKELGINYYICGHHATERYGIQALGHHLAERFDLEHRFIDSNNPV